MKITIVCEEVCEWLLQTSVEFCRRRFNVALIMTNQPTQGFPSQSCYKENISYNITHILYIDRRIHSALYWLTAFYQPQNLSGGSEWIILDHPVFLIWECAGSCSPRHFRTPPMVPSTLSRTALTPLISSKIQIPSFKSTDIQVFWVLGGFISA